MTTEVQAVGKTEKVSANLKILSNDALIAQAHKAVRRELEATADVIRYFQEISDRRLYLDYKYPSMFEMVTDLFGYCNGSAQLRINAMRLIRDVPIVEAKIESGELTLSAAAGVQSFLNLEKKSERPYSLEAKLELIEICSNKSTEEIKREFAKRNPEMEPRDSVKYITEDRIRVSEMRSVDLEEKIQAIKLLWSHVDPEMSRETVLERMTEIVLDHIDPMRKAKRAQARKEKKQSQGSESAKSTEGKAKKPEVHATESLHIDEPIGSAPQSESGGSAKVGNDASDSLHIDELANSGFNLSSKGPGKTEPANSLHIDEPQIKAADPEPTKRSRRIPATENHQLMLGCDGLGCVFVSDITGGRCGSHFQLQRDHISEFANGGTHTAANLRLYCAQHNRHRN